MKILFIFLVLLATTSVASENKYTDFTIDDADRASKGDFWGPFASLLLPGANQWYWGQYAQARLYTGLGLAGSLIAGSAQMTEGDLKEMEDNGFNDTENDRYRRYALGGQIYQVAGGLSAYASFQSTVKYQQENGKYAFIQKQETIDEILLAPFDFSFLERKTTWIPLLSLAGLVALSDGVSAGELSLSDGFYTGAYSYNAGTHEEALFRGWLMPLFHQRFQSAFWGNMTSAVIFAAAHGFSPTPLAQLGMGYYFGWLTQKNDYSIREAVFVHVWWDVIAIAASYMDNKSDNDQMLYVPIYFASF